MRLSDLVLMGQFNSPLFSILRTSSGVSACTCLGQRHTLQIRHGHVWLHRAVL